MSIYIVELHDYDSDQAEGYFTDYEKASFCCDYLNRVRPSIYKNLGWYVQEYVLDETDYPSLIRELDEKEQLEFETRLEKEKQRELAELARLKAKYE